MDAHSAYRQFKNEVRKHVPDITFIHAFNEEVITVLKCSSYIIRAKKQSKAEAGDEVYRRFLKWYKDGWGCASSSHIRGRYLYTLITQYRWSQLYVLSLKVWHDSEDYKEKISN